MDNKPQGAAECVDVLETLEDMSLNDTKGKMLVVLKRRTCITNNQFMVVRIYTSFRFFGSVKCQTICIC